MKEVGWPLGRETVRVALSADSVERNVTASHSFAAFENENEAKKRGKVSHR